MSAPGAVRGAGALGGLLAGPPRGGSARTARPEPAAARAGIAGLRRVARPGPPLQCRP